MTTMTTHPAARVASTKSSDIQYDLLTASLRTSICGCGGDDCATYIARGALKTDGRYTMPQAPSTTLLAMAKRSLVTIDKIGGRIVGAYVTDLGRRVQRQTAERLAYAERTARIVAGR